MTRLMPTTLFNTIFPDKEDPENPGHYLCRFCGKPTTETRRIYYCSDECYWNCQKSVAWWFARRETFKRDKGRCVKCGKKLEYEDTWDCHHIIPVSELWKTAWDSVFDNPDWATVSDEDKMRGYAIIYTLLAHDVNNLVTLCPDCHKLEHTAKPEEVIDEFEIITLDHYFGGTITEASESGRI